MHCAIVPDGNRRWAKSQNKNTYEGHLAGAEAASRILETALDLGVTHLTLWGCSEENLTNRNKAEVLGLTTIFTEYFKKLAERKDIHEKEVRVRVLGKWEEMLPAGLCNAMRAVMKATEQYDKHHLTFLMAYNGTSEMLDAVSQIKKEDGAEPVTGEVLKSHLWSRDLPPVDLVIRTGGEPHWSVGFMMWDVRDAQLHFTETFWPAFTPLEFKRVIEKYRTTERRMGK